MHLFILGLLIALSPLGAQAQRAIPDDNLGYPVLITTPSGNTGSGALVNTSGALFFVTAKHVLFDKGGKLREQAAQLLSYSKDPANREPNIEVLDLAMLDKAGLISAHPGHDVAVIKLADVVTQESADPAGKQYSITLRPGVQIVKSAGLVTAGNDVIKRFEKVLVGNEVVLYGYPISLALEKNHQLEPLRPLLRKGIVAGQNFQNKSIVLDCPVYPGNSGGPVFQVEQTSPFQKSVSMIGIVAEYVPFEDQGRSFALTNNSGYSIATPMDFAIELIEAMQARSGAG
jgi:hypothetical protein